MKKTVLTFLWKDLKSKDRKRSNVKEKKVTNSRFFGVNCIKAEI